MLEAKYIGSQEVERKLRQVKRRLKNLRIVHKSIVVQLDKETQLQFRTEGKHLIGSKWKDILDATKKRRRGGPPYRILQDTGFLKGNWDHIFTQRKAVLRSKVEYGIYHHEGRGHLPERPIIPDVESKQFKNKILKIYSLWIRKQRKNFK